ncbi:MAG: hypothetical protein J6Y49_00615 [Alphaproteobacteria bacterium]|nr:hypothetical protein [Alphaproteobacteria bacterium]
MTKVADKISTATDNASDFMLSRFSGHNKKIKNVVKAPIDKNLSGWGKAARGTGKVIGVGGRVVADTFDISAVVLLFLSKWFVKISDFVLLDNVALDFMEKKYSNRNVKQNKRGKDKAIPKFTKENPRVAAYLSWYLMLLSVVGGVGAVKNKDKIEENVKDKVDNVKNAVHRFLTRKIQNETINTLKIDPTLPQEEWMAQIDAIWPYIYMETILSEGFVNEAYADVGETSGYITIGSGYMIGKATPKGEKDRQLIEERKRFFQKVLGKPYVNGVSVSYEENRLLVRSFYEKFIWPYMKKQFTVPMDAHLFVQLCIGMYNRGSGIYKNSYDGQHIRRAVNEESEMIDIVNKFDDLCKAGNGGLKAKYGIAGNRALGNVRDSVVLYSFANSVYQMNSNKLWQSGKLKNYPEIETDLMNVVSADIHKNGKTYSQLKLNEYLMPDEIDMITNGDLFKDFVLRPQQAKATESSAEKLNEQGEKLYVDGKYEAAIKKFEQAIKENPKLYIVYSNLVIAYYQLGEYDNGITIVDNTINMPDFSNASKEVKGYTYFNGALCYEKLGDNETDSVKKQYYYNKAKEYATTGENVAKTKYKSLMNRLNKKIQELTKNEKVAFNTGKGRVATKLKQKNTVIAQHTKKDEHCA